MVDLPHTAKHAELGIVMLGELIHECAAHDLSHTVQGERADAAVHRGLRPLALLLHPSSRQASQSMNQVS